MKHVSLRVKFVVLFAAVIAVALPLSLAWNNYVQGMRAESEMLEKAQILTQEMDAVWEFMEVNQYRMKSAADMGYTTDDLYCVVAAKSVSKLFTLNTDYIIHYTDATTRQKADAPDEFELEALETFRADDSAKEYYAPATYDGRRVFRYVKPLYATSSCLECHGEPAGELDPIGFPKEGLKEGDIAGAISVIMPVDLYMQSVQESISQQVVFFSLMLIVGIAVIFIGVSVLVTRPLDKLTAVSKRIEQGDYEVSFDGIGYRDDMADMAAHLGTMVDQLRTLNTGLEEIVESRTEQLALANAELKSHRVKLEEINEELENINKKLQEESQYKSDFLAIMSHEIRTPLTAILASTELWEQLETLQDDEETSIVHEIKINGQILLGMINNILEIARIEAEHVAMNYEHIDMVDLVQMVVRTLRPLAASKNIALTAHIEREVPIIVADWEKVRRILENLASNAIKFTKKYGKVDIEVTCDAEKEWIGISVIDNGIGIPDSELPCIFERFTQSDKSAHRRYQGSGLGLAVVKELVDMHGGRIEVSSQYKEGSTFSVFLPVGKNEVGELQ